MAFHVSTAAMRLLGSGKGTAARRLVLSSTKLATTSGDCRRHLLSTIAPSSSSSSSSLSTLSSSAAAPGAGAAAVAAASSSASAALKSRKLIAEHSYFDTHGFVGALELNGFTRQQAEELCGLFKEIVGFVSQDIKRDCVTKPGQELAIQQVMIHIGSLKKDMTILEKSEFSALRNENEKLIMELKSLRENVKDEIIKLRGGFTLDINLEKSRSAEITFDISNRVHKLDSRIDTEISNVKAMLEAFKADTIRYIAGSLFTGLVILLGALRYFSP